MDSQIIAVFNNEIKPNEYHGVVLRRWGDKYVVHYFKQNEIGADYLGEGHQGSYCSTQCSAWTEFNRRVMRLLVDIEEPVR